MTGSTQNVGNKVPRPLSVRNKIFIGGLGALTPIIMNLLVVDLEKLLIQLTPLVVFAYLIKVLILFYIGGMVAFLNKDENKPIKLFQLGIYAPALIIAFMNTNPLQPNTESGGLDNPIFKTQPASPVPDAAPDEQTEPEKNDETGNNTPTAAAKVFSASAATTFINGGDSIIPAITEKVNRLRDTLMRKNLLTNSMIMDPMLESMAEKDSTLLDDFMDKVNLQKQIIENTVLEDTAIYRYTYPIESITEQFMRGIFGVKSERVWYVILDKFENKQDAEIHAKLITKEINDRYGKKSLDWQGNFLHPTIYLHHDPEEATYSVVIGKHMRFHDARFLLTQLSKMDIPSLTSGNAELWKFE